MATIIAPGMWIVPVEPLITEAKAIWVTLEDKPHYCTDLDLIANLFYSVPARCKVCGQDETYLKVREFPDYCFCPTHWRPVLSPKAGAFDYLCTPVPSDKELV